MNKAQKIILDSIKRMANSDSPDTHKPLVTGEINMAYKLDLLTYAERDKLVAATLEACNKRRTELRNERHKNMGMKR